MRSLTTILRTGSLKTRAGGLVLIAALSAEVGLAEKKADLPQLVVAGNLISAGDTSHKKAEPLAPEQGDAKAQSDLGVREGLGGYEEAKSRR